MLSPTHRCIAVVLFALGMALAAYPSAATAGRYERSLQPPTLSSGEGKVLRAVRRWGRSQRLRLVHDARLHLTARWYVERGDGDRTRAIDIEPLREQARRWGWTDGELSALRLRIPSLASLAPLRQLLSRRMAGRRINRVGVAVRRTGSHWDVMVLLSQQRVHLQPFAAWLPPRRDLRLRGRIDRGMFASAARPEAIGMTLVTAAAEGASRRTPVPLSGRDFAITVGPAFLQGPRVDVQLLLDVGGGPEIAAQFPLQIGVPAWSATPVVMPPTLRSAAPAGDAMGAERRLLEAITTVRRRQDLPVLPVDAVLAEAARSHARDMVDNGFFAHVSPSSGDVTRRLHRRGVHFLRAWENLGQGVSVDEIFREWMLSPSHRANLLDKQARQVGIGVALVQHGEARRLVAVCVLAQPTAGSQAVDQ